ncbi:MAG: signal peptidase I [Nanoarchaeota archaeon]|nr:signal peptidase I [Nanoarchaeota archaeon]
MAIKIKNTLKKVWHFIWEDDSIWSWIVNILLAFLIIKFLVYPGLGFALGTTHPVVAVVSGSMEHEGSFDSWWDSQEYLYSAYGLTNEQFITYRFKNGFNKGDIIILKKAKPESLKIGDVIVFRTVGRPDPVIHRIVRIDSTTPKYLFTTKGDHNLGSLDEEIEISEDRLIGKGVFKIPWLGWIKIGFVETLNWIF